MGLGNTFFLTDLRRVMSEMLVSGFIKGRKGKGEMRSRKADLIHFAENLGAACAGEGGPCDNAQTDHTNSGCCSYHMCSKASTNPNADWNELYIEEPVISPCSAYPQALYAKVVLKVSDRFGNNGCVI